MLFKSTRNEYVDTEGPVRYLDGSGLARPLDMPKPQLALMAVFVVAAAVIGGLLLFNILDSVQGSAARAQASVEENLSRDVSYDLPALASLAGMDDDGIRQTFVDAGLTTYEKPVEEGAENTGLEIVKLPADVSVEQAGLLSLGGISKLDAADAALLLNGSWTLSVDRREGIDMRLRYADFSSGGVDAAIEAAIAAEGFDPATVAEDGKGVDEVGNTFTEGTVDSYRWRVSAIALSDVYDIKGLPESAVYVGIRLTA